MNLDNYIQERLQHKKLLLMTHAVVGYPSLEENWQMLETMQEMGVDLVELQMPFSEPIADGPLFAKANHEALKNGITQQIYFDFMKKATERFDFAILMMGYYNNAFMMGHETFCKALKSNGGSGFIIPDLPIEEFGDLFQQSQDHDLAPIILCAPTNTDERLRLLLSKVNGFAYCVARKGVTGAKTQLTESVETFIQRCRQHTKMPLALGFGLSHGTDLEKLHGMVEIAIVGSALLKVWESEGLEGYRERMRELVASCK